jgi:hypothetical protein
VAASEVVIKSFVVPIEISPGERSHAHEVRDARLSKSATLSSGSSGAIGGEQVFDERGSRQSQHAKCHELPATISHPLKPQSKALFIIGYSVAYLSLGKAIRRLFSIRLYR